MPGSIAQPKASDSGHPLLDLEAGFGLHLDLRLGVTDLTCAPSKGGDPAAPSGTATLLRLRPSHQTRPRRLPPLRVSSATSIVLGFHDVTGGVYKARERIHRSVLTCGY